MKQKLRRLNPSELFRIKEYSLRLLQRREYPVIKLYKFGQTTNRIYRKLVGNDIYKLAGNYDFLADCLSFKSLCHCLFGES